MPLLVMLPCSLAPSCLRILGTRPFLLVRTTSSALPRSLLALMPPLTSPAVRTSSATFVTSPPADRAGLSDPPRPSTTGGASPTATSSGTLLRTPSLAAPASGAVSPWDAMADSLPPLGSGSPVLVLPPVVCSRTLTPERPATLTLSWPAPTTSKPTTTLTAHPTSTPPLSALPSASTPSTRPSTLMTRSRPSPLTLSAPLMR
mmetsp:Transcript_8095/g.16340  ORF Transcript_8095/g.16340 Transcript_8095/m.16340 type:complete len:203 (-) Transcript_8095:418-1026(-)